MLVKGMLTWLPGVHGAFFDPSAGGGTASASYCYGVWMKHLVLLWERGMREVPRDVLELGPGASIGTGVAALLCGARSYIGLDAQPHGAATDHAAVFRELVRLLQSRAPRPAPGFPSFDHLLDERLFPSAILDEERLSRSLSAARIASIGRAVHALDGGRDAMLRYRTWDTLDGLEDASLDLVFSHVVMTQVEDLDAVYACCGRWLRPGGWMSHQFDCTSLGTAEEWNGHWAYGETAWKIIAGRRPYFVNREPLATHFALMRRHGLDIVKVIRGYKPGGISRAQLAPRWRGISDEDLSTQSAFVVARRRTGFQL